MILYLIKQNKIPKLVFDGVWKRNDEVTVTGMRYFLKVKQVKGEVNHMGFRASLELRISWNQSLLHCYQIILI